MSEQAFPPEDPGSFLSLCDGEWMSLRSCFELAAGGDDEWHSSERGELTVRCVSEQGALGQLQVQAPGGTSSTLTFAADGQLILDGDSPGNWRFWPDGSMELNLSRADGVQGSGADLVHAGQPAPAQHHGGGCARNTGAGQFLHGHPQGVQTRGLRRHGLLPP